MSPAASGASSMRRWRVLTTILRGLSTLPVRFAGQAGGAAAALGAGVAVEQVLPGQVGHVGRAEVLGVLGLEIHGAHDAHRPRAGGVGEPDVGQRRDDVQVLGVRQVVEEDEDQQRVRPEAGDPAGVGDRRRQPAHDRSERVGDRPLHAEASRFEHQLEGADEEERDHEHGDHREDEHRVARVHVVALQPPWLDDQATVEQDGDGGQHEQPECLLRQGIQRVDGPGEKVDVAEARDHALDQDLERAEPEHQEAPEDEGVQRTGHRVAQDLHLQQAGHHEVLQPGARMVGPVVGLAHGGHVVDQPLDVVREEPCGEQQDGEEDQAGGRHVVRLRGAGSGITRPASRGRRSDDGKLGRARAGGEGGGRAGCALRGALAGARCAVRARCALRVRFARCAVRNDNGEPRISRKRRGWVRAPVLGTGWGRSGDGVGTEWGRGGDGVGTE